MNRTDSATIPTPPTPAHSAQSHPLGGGTGGHGRVETRPEAVVESVFLSPRVVDRKAFGEMSGELRGLVERAAAERNAIAGSLEQALGAVKHVRESEASQAGNLALAAKALKGLDERIAKATKLIESAEAAAAGVRELESQSERIIQDKLAALEARIQAAQAAAQARAEALEERLRSANRDIEQRIDALRRDAASMVGANVTALHEGVAKAEALTTGPNALKTLVERGETVRMSAESAMRRLEDVQTIAASSRETMSGLLSELASVMGRVDAQRETLGVEADRVRTACKEAGANIDQRLLAAQGIAMSVAEDARRAADEAILEIKPRVEAAAREVADAATDATRVVGEVHQSAEQLQGLIKQAYDAHNTSSISLRLIEKSTTQVQGLLKSLEPWRVWMDGTPGAQTPAPVQGLVDIVRRELRGELSQIATALRTAAMTAERTIDAVDAGGSERGLTPTATSTGGWTTVLGASPTRERANLAHAAD